MNPIKFLLFFCVAMTGSSFTTIAPTRARSNRVSSLSLSPIDFPDASSILLVKSDGKALAFGVLQKINPELGAQVLSDGSHALMDFPTVLKHKKITKLQMRYANVMGRLMILGIGLLPHHGFTPEELGVQLFLLGVSIKPVIRSIQLYRCISSSKCLEECQLEFDELEESLP